MSTRRADCRSIQPKGEIPFVIVLTLGRHKCILYSRRQIAAITFFPARTRPKGTSENDQDCGYYFMNLHHITGWKNIYLGQEKHLHSELSHEIRLFVLKVRRISFERLVHHSARCSYNQPCNHYEKQTEIENFDISRHCSLFSVFPKKSEKIVVYLLNKR